MNAIVLTGLSFRDFLRRNDGEEVAVRRGGLEWRYTAGQGLTVLSGEQPVAEVPEADLDALDEARWEVAADAGA